MSGKNSKTAEAAVAAASAPVVNQTAATAAEAGVPVVPTSEKSYSEVDAVEAGQAIINDAEGFARFLSAAFNDDELAQVLAAVQTEVDRRGLVTVDSSELAPEADVHAATRELLTRFNLKRAWQDATGNVHFDEKAARKAAGDNADSLTVIEA